VDDVTLAFPTYAPKATASPAGLTLVTGGHAPFTAEVTGYASDNRVDWGITSNGGTFNPQRTAGDAATATTFTAGTTPGAFTVTATPVEANGTAATLPLTLVDPSAVTVTLVPSATTVSNGATVTFTTSVTPLTDKAVAWTAQGGSFIGTPGLTAAWSSPAAGDFTITATSHGAPTRSASAQIHVVDPAVVPLAVTPASAILSPGASAPFTASGDQGAGVDWAIAPQATHADQGLTTTVTAPAAAPMATTLYTLTATQKGNPARTALATLTVKGLDILPDGLLDPRDLLILAAEWGKDAASPANFKGTGTVDDTDLAALLTLIK